MSRIGKHPVPVPSDVEVSLEGGMVRTKGKLGELEMALTDSVVVKYEDSQVSVAPRDHSRHSRNMWATTRTNIANMVKGVSQGFERRLEIQGVGYRAQVKGSSVQLSLGYSHDIDFPIPEDLKVRNDGPGAIIISGASKQRVGQIAAKIRGLRPPEPYKGKGVRYAGERIIIKEGKKK